MDSFSTDAHLLHALVILNGICAQTSTQLPDMKYRLVRVLGRVLGLDWSQMNLNVFTHSPAPTSTDYAGLTIMHATDPINCVPISICYPNADQPKMDDRAALSRLYPVTAQNQAAFPGKQLFFENTVRIHGSVYFADSNGQAAQPMQGVNVVARWIDPATSQPSRTYGAASVSGFLFRGNAGNAATGFYDSSGQAWDRFGSDDAAVEGFFDLGGLEIPNGASSAQYQLSVEGIGSFMVAARGTVRALAGAAFRCVPTLDRDCEQGRRSATGHSDAGQRGAGPGLLRAYFIRGARDSAAFRRLAWDLEWPGQRRLLLVRRAIGPHVVSRGDGAR